jgi:exosome complex RNA-binding protein Rrp42 (RNase PH superfamily)
LLDLRLLRERVCPSNFGKAQLTACRLAVLDPTHLESQLSEGTLTLTLNAQSEICVLTKAGGSPLKVVDIMRCLNLASSRIKDIDKAVKLAVQEDLKGKISVNDGGRGETIR